MRFVCVILAILSVFTPLAAAPAEELFSKVDSGDVKGIKAALEASPELLKASGDEGQTLLHRAAEKEKESVVALLLEMGAEVDAEDELGMTALHKAAAEGHAQIIEALIAGQAEVNHRDQAGRTPLHWAVRKGRYQAVKTLLKNHAWVNVKNKAGKTAMDLALKYEHQGIIRLLRDAGAEE